MKTNNNTAIIAASAIAAVTVAAKVSEHFGSYKFVTLTQLQAKDWVPMDEQVVGLDGFFERRAACIGTIVFRKGIIPVLVPIYLIQNGTDTAAVISRKKDGRPLYVNVNEKFVYLPEIQRKAILLHEAGHIVNESSQMEALTSEQANKRVYENELNADKFAAAIVGTEEYCNMLWALSNTHDGRVDEGVMELLQRAADLGDTHAQNLLKKWEAEAFAELTNNA